MDATEPAGNAVSIARETALAVLESGEMELEGLLPWGSNYAFLVYVSQDGVRIPAVYKPMRGERPLWDFPTGTLGQREVAAYVVSEAFGWGLVPPTVFREGHHGPGSVQFFVDFNPESHYFTLSDDEKSPLRRVAVFDYVANNADRKGGHVLRDTRDTLWLIDHGLCFHWEYKLRTVIWDFAGQPIPAGIVDDLCKFGALIEPGGALLPALEPLLSRRELAALRRRTDQLLDSRCFPEPGPGRNYPWPPL